MVDQEEPVENANDDRMKPKRSDGTVAISCRDIF